jgi:hypothetical protein
MRIKEIDNTHRSFLKLKDIIYNFDELYSAIENYYRWGSLDPKQSKFIKVGIEFLQQKISEFVNEVSDDNDLDVIDAKQKYKNLEDIKNSL